MSYPTSESAAPLPRYRDPKFLRDAAERVAWTAAQAGLSVFTVDSFDLPLWSLPMIAAGLAAVKAYVAKHIGNSDSASTVPSV